MTNELWSAILNPAGPNYQTWHDALGSDRVSLISPRSIMTDMGEERNVEAYLLDLRALTLGQRARLLSAVAKRFGVPVYEVESEVARVGFPIRAADVIVAISLRAVI
jgi:hypothetical protein